MGILTEAALFFGAVINFTGEFWWSKWLMILSVGTLVISIHIIKKYHWTAGLAFAWYVGSGIWVFANRQRYFENTTPTGLAIDNTALYTTVSLIVLVVMVVLMEHKSVLSIEKLIGGLCLWDSLVVICQWIGGAGPDMRMGFLGNPSMNGSFIAITYPFVAFLPDEKMLGLKIGRKYLGALSLCAIPVLAVVLSGSTIPVIAMAVCWATWICLNKEFEAIQKIKDRIPLALTLILAFWIMGSQLVPDFYGSSGRLVVWKESMIWWWDNMNPIYGSGLGTYMNFGPYLLQGKADQIWIWMHSDWLQCLFETGAVGLVLALSVFIAAVMQSVRKGLNHVTISIITYGAVAAVNFPGHLGVHAFVAVFLLRRAFG